MPFLFSQNTNQQSSNGYSLKSVFRAGIALMTTALVTLAVRPTLVGEALTGFDNPVIDNEFGPDFNPSPMTNDFNIHPGDIRVNDVFVDSDFSLNPEVLEAKSYNSENRQPPSINFDYIQQTEESGVNLFDEKSSFPTTINISNLDGDGGVIIYGDETGAGCSTVAKAFDMNGDKINDILIGCRFHSVSGRGNPGVSYLIYGDDELGKPGGNFNLEAIDGKSGVKFLGVDDGDNFGVGLAGLNDINGDGINDIIINSYDATRNGLAECGESYLVYGDILFNRDAVIDISALSNDTQKLIVFTGDNAGAVGGKNTYLGDINNDAINDFLISEHLYTNFNEHAGRVTLIFGANENVLSNISSLTNHGDKGRSIYGIQDEQRVGWVPASVDANNDGVNDLLIGAHYTNSGDFEKVGAAYVIFGEKNMTSQDLVVSNLVGSDGYMLIGASEDDYTGQAVWHMLEILMVMVKMIMLLALRALIRTD